MYREEYGEYIHILVLASVELIFINSVLGSPKLGKIIEQIHFAMFKAVVLDSRGRVGERGENGEGKEGVDGRGGSR